MLAAPLQIVWLVLAGLVALAATRFSYFARRRIVQLTAAGFAAAAAITMALLRLPGSGLTTDVPILAIAAVAAIGVFIAVLRRFDGERPSVQLVRHAFKDWKVSAPIAGAILAPAIAMATLDQSLLVSFATIAIAAAAVFGWRFAIFTNTDRPQPQLIEADEYRPRGFDPNTKGARHG